MRPLFGIAATGLTTKLVVGGVVVCAVAVVLAGAARIGIGVPQQPVGAVARAEIPDGYLSLYQAAAQTCPGLPWSVLAAVGKVESDHGRNAGVSTGARGPMQFLPSTWASFGIDATGDGRADINDPADAIVTAAGYLCAHGARDGRDLRAALYAYNHSAAYADQVLQVAARYDIAADEAVTPVTGSGAVAARVIAFARAQVGKAYRWGAEGPAAFDCSGLTMKAYAAAGIVIPRTTFDQWPFGVRVPAGREQPGDLVFFNTGPGASKGHPGHVGIVIGGGKMIEARCTLCGPIAVASYRSRPHLEGFTRPWAR